MSSHELLWAPWRQKWVQGLALGTSTECPFCQNPAEPDSPANLIVHRGQTGFVLLNLYPYNGGHLLCVPYRHVRNLLDLDSAERAELMELAALSQRALLLTHHPHGFNLGLNQGKAGGAGIEQHLHMHVLPRWEGDSNFLSTTAGTRILSEPLEDTWSRVQQAFASL